MTKAIRIDQNGGPEQLKLVDALRAVHPGEVQIRHHAVGLNFIDVYQRTGLYQLPHAAHARHGRRRASSRRWARASRT